MVGTVEAMKPTDEQPAAAVTKSEAEWREQLSPDEYERRTEQRRKEEQFDTIQTTRAA